MPDIRPSDSVTVVGPDVSFKGEMSFEGSMKLEGKFEGKITSKGRLGLGKGGQITADVTVGQFNVEGTFKGNVTATERIELAASAHVLGDIRAPKLVIAEGASFVGNVHVSPDALKDVAKAEYVVPMAATPIKK
jgi:cytoskeletal protein CcmA (bactofilin family)